MNKTKTKTRIILFLYTLISVFIIPGCQSNITEQNQTEIYEISESQTFEKDAFIEETSTVIEDFFYEETTTSTSAVTEDFSYEETIENPKLSQTDFNPSDIPEYSGKPYIAVNNNIPFFNASDLTESSFEKYLAFDNLGRCGVAYACIGKDIMPTEKRGSIGSVKPSGWHTVKYDSVDGKYLYNRCHLIGYQLTGENANEKNLITGTRYLNIEGMLPFENMTADYVKETNNHVLYRVTPIFEGNNLLAGGVLMEGYSVEDKGAGICFCIYAYNAQPDIEINYSNGNSELSKTVKTPANEEIQSSTKVSPSVPVSDENKKNAPVSAPAENKKSVPVSAPAENKQKSTYILNTRSDKFHYPSCSSVKQMAEKNKRTYTGTREEVIEQGFSPCRRCNP